MEVNPNIEDGWKKALENEFQKEYFATLKKFLIQEITKKKTLYPSPRNIFAAFHHAAFDKVRVVILGQDPYHGPGQANGLCFSVGRDVPLPPSLKNIFLERQEDLGIPLPKTGDLQKWADQGVLLLNAILTVEAHQAASHQGKGWEEFTDSVIRRLSEEKEGIVFLLWGKYAQDKGKVIDTSKHFVLSAAHPSPLSAHNGFFGCKHFSKTNDILKAQSKEPIDWTL